MQIKFKKGMTIDDMIVSLQKLKEQELDEYDILKTDATLYINLKNNNNLICPKNELEYYIHDRENITDVLSELKQEAQEECYQAFYRYLINNLSLEKKLTSSLNNAQKNLEKAKARKAKTIEKWETEIEKIKYNILKFQKTKPILEDMYNNIKRENMLFHTMIKKEKSNYKNTIQIGVCITFSYKDKIKLFGCYDDTEYDLWSIKNINDIETDNYMFY